MKSLLRQTTTLIATGLFLMTSACTTIKPVYNIDEESYASKIKVGDRVRLTYLDNRATEIRVTKISETRIEGTYSKSAPHQPKGALVVADWEDIYAVETVKVSAIKTAGAAVGVVVALPFLALGAIMAGAGG